MTTRKARDLLDKELFVNRNIVTFRSLSRQLGIHVNDAKNELQRYYDAARDTDTPAVPTYLVSGEVSARRRAPSPSTHAMDLDLAFEEDRKREDVVCQSRVLLVDARALEQTSSRFSRVHSVHIYSLSPSRFGDAGMVCTPSFGVRQADAQGGPASFAVVGKLTGAHVKLKSGAPHKSAASSSKTTLDIPLKAVPKETVPVKLERQATKGKNLLDTKQGVSTTPLPKADSKEKQKPSGKLDWSKAKTKEKESVAQKPREDRKPKPEPESTVVSSKISLSPRPGLESTKPSVSSSKPERSSVTGDAKQRGMKRKPDTDSDPESDPESLWARAKPSGPSVRKGAIAIDSDEDDDSDTQVRKLGQRRIQKKSTLTSDSEMSLRAMMDIDDDQVDRVSRLGTMRTRDEEDEEGSESNKEGTAPPVTSEGEESDPIPVVTRKRKPRKVVPVSRNGMKKRRIVKSRTTTDAKGYMQTEDYSSYESVEEEVVVETKPKGRGRGKKGDVVPAVEETKPKGKGKETKGDAVLPEEEMKPRVKGEGTAKPKAKSTAKSRGGAAKRGGLHNFFGSEKK